MSDSLIQLIAFASGALWLGILVVSLSRRRSRHSAWARAVAKKNFDIPAEIFRAIEKAIYPKIYKKFLNVRLQIENNQSTSDSVFVSVDFLLVNPDRSPVVHLMSFSSQTDPRLETRNFDEASFEVTKSGSGEKVSVERSPHTGNISFVVAAGEELRVSVRYTFSAGQRHIHTVESSTPIVGKVRIELYGSPKILADSEIYSAFETQSTDSIEALRQWQIGNETTAILPGHVATISWRVQ